MIDRHLLALALAGSLAGCGPATAPGESEESIPVAQVPEDVKKVAAAELPGVELEQAWKITEPDGGIAYEVRGRDDQGKTREVKVSAAGKVLETE